MAKVSIRDISRATGFSPATVSNALNHKRSVSEQTAKIIRETARSMGYQQQSQGKTTIQFLQARKTGQVIDQNAFQPAVIEGIERQARRYGMGTMFVNIDLSDLEAARPEVESLTGDPASALVLLGTELSDEDYELFAGAEAHIVVLDGWSRRYSFDAVLISNEDSAIHAVGYLLERGHTAVGHLAGRPRIHNFKAREAGYERALEHAGIEPRPEWRVELDTTFEAACRGMGEWLEGPGAAGLPTAFFADNDVLAVAAMRALSDHGVRVPEDVSIIGFDDLSMGAFSTPSLTTMHVLKQEAGEIAVRQLVDGIENERGYTCKTEVSTYLVERGSVRDLRG